MYESTHVSERDLKPHGPVSSARSTTTSTGQAGAGGIRPASGGAITGAGAPQQR